ncbi:MAG: nucleotidyltransferase domain-containing protein [Methanomicrobia archaeon]|nr:nucleotidyltransferase domain-containing protein [Methanomicrobia archaeon]
MQSFIVEESWNSVKIFWLDQERLRAELCRTAQKVGERDQNVVKIILFGSLAENRAVPGSDADILLVLKRSSAPFLKRIEEWSEKFAVDFPIELFPYTEEELDNPVVQNAMAKGITLFERQ